MGWTGVHRSTSQPLKQFLDDEVAGRGQVVASALVGFTEYHAAYRRPDGRVAAVAVMVRHNPHDHYNLSFKAMSETMGPVINGCPARVLDALDPVDDLHGPGTQAAEYAQQWRDGCRARLDVRASHRGTSRGDHVTFAHPIGFSDGVTEDAFRYVKGSTFVRAGDGRRVRVRGWRERARA